MNFEELKHYYTEARTARELYRQEVVTLQTRLAELQSEKETLATVTELVQKTAKTLQQRLVSTIEHVVNVAFETIFHGEYEFRIQFLEKRGRVEPRIVFVRDGNEIEPADAVGGGAIDVAAMALRLAFWSLKKTSPPVLVFDEPMKFLSTGYREFAGKLISRFSRRMGVQMIIVTHMPELVVWGDRVFQVELHGGKSIVRVEKTDGGGE